MSGQTTTYSFDDVDVVFTHPGIGQYVVSGTGVGSISVTMQTDKTSHDVAADGSVMIFNYSKQPYIYNGKTVESMSYRLEKPKSFWDIF